MFLCASSVNIVEPATRRLRPFTIHVLLNSPVASALSTRLLHFVSLHTFNLTPPQHTQNKLYVCTPHLHLATWRAAPGSDWRWNWSESRWSLILPSMHSVLDYLCFKCVQLLMLPGLFILTWCKQNQKKTKAFKNLKITDRFLVMIKTDVILYYNIYIYIL